VGAEPPVLLLAADRAPRRLGLRLVSMLEVRARRRGGGGVTLDDLIAERAALSELMIFDARARTDANVRRRDSLDRKIRRWRAQGTPRTNRYGYLGSGPFDSRNGSARAMDPLADQTLRLCEGCGEPLPEYHGGRKTCEDACYCPGGACRQRAYRARHSEEVPER
jgi:hypothetical protein